MKIFVWNEFLTDYTSGIAVAVARDVSHARELVTNAYAKELSEDPKSAFVQNRMADELAAEPSEFELTDTGFACFCYGGG